MRNIPYFKGVIRPTKPGNWRCLFPTARNMYIINRRQLIGEFCAELRQLEILGYEPIVVRSEIIVFLSLQHSCHELKNYQNHKS